MQNSFEVARTIVQDIENLPDSDKLGFESIRTLLPHKRFTFYKDFIKIAEFETKHGRKVTTIDEMFDIINEKL